MHVLDLTGPITTGMWSYEPPFPTFQLCPLPEVPWVRSRVYCDIFDGMNSQTGTYLETPAHVLGNASYPLDAVPVEKLTDIPCRILQVPSEQFGGGVQKPVSRPMLEQAAGADLPHPGEAILVSTGWGTHWDRPDFLIASPYFTTDAMEWLISFSPFLVGSDMPRWEYMKQPAGVLNAFYEADILLLAPCIHLELAGTGRGQLTALPVRVAHTCCAPCRAILKPEPEPHNQEVVL